VAAGRLVATSGRLSAWTRARPDYAVLTALLLFGLALRTYFTVVWHPALTGYSDSGIYFQDGVQSVWTDPIRTVGYSMFLRVLHGISPHLILVVIVQHLLGLATAALYFFTVRRAGGPRWLGLVPAAAIALAGDQLFIEHSALSDSGFIFLLAVMLYCTVRAHTSVRDWRPGVGWAVAAGFAAGFAVWDREAALELAPLLALWLVFSHGRPTRRTVVIGVASLIAAGVAVEGYIQWRQADTGLSGLTTNGNWNVYGRVGPWADCRYFTPPVGTRALCQYTPLSQRGWPSADFYIYSPASPAQRLIGPPYLISKDPYAMQRLLEFSQSAVAGQPLDYLYAVWRDTIRLFDPEANSFGDLSPQGLVNYLVSGIDGHGHNAFVTYWQNLLYPHDGPEHRGAVGPLKEWEKLTRLTGASMALLLILLLAAPWLAPPGLRSVAVLLGLVSLVLLFFPILLHAYDYRFVIPALGPLFAVGGISAWGWWLWIKAGRRGTAPRPVNAEGPA
jgi:dolichyl-phosphate-mannose-protein mannosyltransferase